MAISSSPYIDIFIENGTFRIEEYTSKPKNSSAISILNKIDEVLQGNLQLQPSATEPNLEDPNFREFLQDKAIEIKKNYNSKIDNLNCIQKIFHKKLPENKLYFDIVIEGDKFHLAERPFKPNSSGLALSTLQSINTAITMLRLDQLTYAEEYSDKYSEMSKQELLEALMQIAAKITDSYQEKREKSTFFQKIFSRNEQNTIDITTKYIIGHPVFPCLLQPDNKTPLTNIIQKVLAFLEISDLGVFGQLNQQGNLQQQLAILNRAQEYDYKGDNVSEAKIYLKDLFNQIYNFYNFFSDAFINKSSDGLMFQKNFIKKNISLDTDPNSIFKLVSNDTIFFDKKIQLARKIITKPKNSLTITQISDAAIKNEGQKAMEAIACQEILDLNLIEFLLQKGADPSPLFYLCYKNIELLELYLKYKINILPQCTDVDTMTTLLAHFTENGEASYVELLLNNGAPVNPKICFSLLIIAIAKQKTDVVKVLLNHGASPNELFEGESPLMLALSNGDTNIAELLLQAGASLNTLPMNGMPLLTYYVCQNTLETVKFLIEKGLDPNVASSTFESPLIYAFLTEKTDIAEFLIRNGADLTLPHSEGSYPIHFAAQAGSLNIISLLLDANVDIDKQGMGGATPLSFACGYGFETTSEKSFHPSIETVESLLQHNANSNIPADDGSTPLRLAQKNGLKEIEALLIKAGAKL